MESLDANGILAQPCGAMRIGIMKSTIAQDMAGMGCFAGKGLVRK